jgi:hypothetical protein
MARPERFELPALWFEARCSIQLSYGRVTPLYQSNGCTSLSGPNLGSGDSMSISFAGFRRRRARLDRWPRPCRHWRPNPNSRWQSFRKVCGQ